LSCLFHAAALVILALVTLAAGNGRGGVSLTAHMGLPHSPEALEQERLIPIEIPSAGIAVPSDIDAQDPELTIPVETPVADETEFLDGIGLVSSLPANWFKNAGVPSSGGLGDRSLEGRAGLVGIGGPGGPSRDSEAAVERGLLWLVAHQLADGSWHFNHHKSLCRGLCRNPGTVGSTTGATAMALLAFLGAGYTHQSGEYQDLVRRGLYYLKTRAFVTADGIDLQEGTMYAQGLAAIALCEAYAMTRDPSLKELAQGAIDWIVYAQDREGGGWRYRPHEPGDTTVTGWQVMALKSGDMAGLRVPSPAFFLAQEFLNRVQCEGGARYGYMSTDPRRTTTAIGLLCRMYAGWGHNHPILAQGVTYLDQWGPSENNIYYNYYATQVMFHWQGSDWKRWSQQMRDRLVAAQAIDGHEAGSWYFADKNTAPGGRLCSTALAVMTLEVYYRYMPLYGKKAFDNDR
jgi:hypothetical protein